MLEQLRNEINLLTNRTIPFTSIFTNLIVTSNLIYSLIGYLIMNRTESNFLLLVNTSSSILIPFIPYLYLENSDIFLLFHLVSHVVNNHYNVMRSLIEMVVIFGFINLYTKNVDEEYRNNFNWLYCLLSLKKTIAFYALTPLFVLILQVIRNVVNGIQEPFVLLILSLIINNINTVDIHYKLVVSGLLLMKMNTMESYEGNLPDLILFIVAIIITLPNLLVFL
jgi:hypothetical protein